MSNKLRKNIMDSHIFKCIIDNIEQDTNIDFSLDHINELIELLGNKINNEDDLDKYLSFKLNNSKKVFITYRVDIFKRIYFLKKFGIESIVLFIYEDMSEELRSLIHHFSNKVKINIIQINNENKVKTNSKSDYFLINLDKNGIVKNNTYSLSDYHCGSNYIKNLIYGEDEIKSNKELYIVEKVLKNQDQWFHIRFDYKEFCYYRDIGGNQSRGIISENEYFKLSKKVMFYKRNMINKRKFNKALRS